MQIIFSPNWFSLIEVMTSGISAAVAILLALYIFKIHSFTKDARHKHFSGAFLAISGAFLASAITHLFAAYNIFGKHAKGLAFYSFNIIRTPTILYAIGELTFRFLMLVGLISILYVLNDGGSKKQYAYTLFLALIVALFSLSHYYIFFLSTLVIGALITYEYLNNYFKIPTRRTACLFAGFAIITFSQGMLIFAALRAIYVQAILVQLLGFILLLATYLQLKK